jgi:hypothetical protein
MHKQLDALDLAESVPETSRLNCSSCSCFVESDAKSLALHGHILECAGA